MSTVDEAECHVFLKGGIVGFDCVLHSSFEGAHVSVFGAVLPGARVHDGAPVEHQEQHSGMAGP